MTGWGYDRLGLGIKVVGVRASRRHDRWGLKIHCHDRLGLGSRVCMTGWDWDLGLA